MIREAWEEHRRLLASKPPELLKPLGLLPAPRGGKVVDGC